MWGKMHSGEMFLLLVASQYGQRPAVLRYDGDNLLVLQRSRTLQRGARPDGVKKLSGIAARLRFVDDPSPRQHRLLVLPDPSAGVHRFTAQWRACVQFGAIFIRQVAGRIFPASISSRSLGDLAAGQHFAAGRTGRRPVRPAVRASQSRITGDLALHELGIEPHDRMIFVNIKYSCLATVRMTHSFKPVW
jgi:Domain of unknown function (DUF4915)